MSCLPNLNRIAGLHSLRWGGLAEEIRRTDLALTTTPEEVIDKCKTICESVLKSILVEQKIKSEDETEKIDMEGLKVLLLEHLPFEEVDRNLIRSEIDFIVRLRNQSGVGGHGRSLQRQTELRLQIDPKRNERALLTVDSLLTFLIQFFEDTYPINDSNERFEVYDEYLDTTYDPVDIEGLQYTASEIVSNTNPEWYKKAATEFIINQEEQSEDNTN
jgi:hypothetical protein